MKIQDCLKKEALDTYIKRKNFLSQEVELLKNHMELLHDLNEIQEKPLWRAVYESASTRAVKLLRNSGYTFSKLRSFIKQKTLREYRIFVYPIIDKLGKREEELKKDVEALKHFRDRIVVHLDPRFVFNEKRLNENFVEVTLLDKVNDFLQHMAFTLFIKDIKI
ncbi:MAG: hypothetical protein FXF54_10375 [Kosmotoga sp.]|nr:MAG: hypothetical protein FXF54_10375 [Kosmotoga sp.]